MFFSMILVVRVFFFHCDFTSDHDKPLLIHELEKHISKDDYNLNKRGLHNTSLIIDFMGNLIH